MLRVSLAMVSGITFMVTAGFTFAGTQPNVSAAKAHKVPELSAFTPAGEQTQFIQSTYGVEAASSPFTTSPAYVRLQAADWLLPDTQGLLPAVDNQSNQDATAPPPSLERPKVETIAAPSAIWAGLTALLGLAGVSAIARWRRWMVH